MPSRLFACQAGTPLDSESPNDSFGHFCCYSVRNESAVSARFGRNFNENSADISAY